MQQAGDRIITAAKNINNPEKRKTLKIDYIIFRKRKTFKFFIQYPKKQ